MKSLLLCLLIIIIITSGCGDDPVITTPSVTTDFSGEWIGYDCIGLYETQPDMPDDTCYLNVTQHGTSVSGEVYFSSPDLSTKTDFTGEVIGNEMYISFKDPLKGHTVEFNMIYNKIINSSDTGSDNSSIYSTWKNTTIGASDDMSFSQLDQELDNLDTGKVNTYFLEKRGGTGSPVIFIHGMTGTAANWDNKWVPFLQANGFYSKHEVWLYQYDWKQHIQINGTDLLNRIKSQNFQTPPILVGHSMGGLVSRSYISQGGNFTKLVTLSTPHLGSPLANNVILTIGALKGLDTDGPHDLSPSSDFIKSINTDSVDIASRNKYYSWGAEMHGHWQVSLKGLVWVWDGNYNDSYSGVAKLGWVLISGDNDGLVPINSSLLTGTNIQQPVQNIDHFQYLDPSACPDVTNYILDL